MDGFFGFDKVSAHDDNVELLLTVYDPSALVVIESVLGDAEIPYLCRERGSGGMMKVIAGFSVFGTDVFVLKEHLDVAKAILQSDEFVWENSPETEEESDD
jgi:hypothetical protein